MIGWRDVLQLINEVYKTVIGKLNCKYKGKY